MKKIISILTIGIVLMASCKPKENTPEHIRTQIIEYKKQQEELGQKIQELEQELNKNGDGSNSLKVETLEVATKNFEHYIDVTANVDADLNTLISPQMNGQITNIYVKEGDRVPKGKILAKMNDDVLRKNLAQLQTSLLLADTLFAKQKKLYEQKIISEIEYLKSKNQKEALEKNIEMIQTQINMAVIKAPFSGIVDRIHLKEGEMAAPGRVFIQMVNLSKMVATADVPENYLPKLNIGNKVEITFPTYPEIKIDSKIYQTGNVIDNTSRTFRVKVNFNNIDNKIKPNMLSVIRFMDFKADNAIVVPTKNLTQDISGWFIYTIKQENEKYIAVKKYVQIGVSDKKETIVLKGLQAGDKIITKGHNLIKDGMQISINN